MRWVQHLDGQGGRAAVSPSPKCGLVNSMKCRIFVQIEVIEADTCSPLLEVAKKFLEVLLYLWVRFAGWRCNRDNSVLLPRSYWHLGISFNR